jgi:hypothetical protein
MRLTVKVITTNLKLLKQQDWREKCIILSERGLKTPEPPKSAEFHSFPIKGEGWDGGRMLHALRNL